MDGTWRDFSSMLIGPLHCHQCLLNYPIGQLCDFLLPAQSCQVLSFLIVTKYTLIVQLEFCEIVRKYAPILCMLLVRIPRHPACDHQGSSDTLHVVIEDTMYSDTLYVISKDSPTPCMS